MKKPPQKFLSGIEACAVVVVITSRKPGAGAVLPLRASPWKAPLVPVWKLYHDKNNARLPRGSIQDGLGVTVVIPCLEHQCTPENSWGVRNPPSKKSTGREHATGRYRWGLVQRVAAAIVHANACMVDEARARSSSGHAKTAAIYKAVQERGKGHSRDNARPRVYARAGASGKSSGTQPWPSRKRSCTQ